ncbi:hypothetical protein CACET_c33350 [Clostridium aceticum]|uniref:Uncharacterized protein n=1 Tax=Clostridium aceticum TaxID=84022 RepID=A0A0D8IEB5_9CLOT|nr:hypothetical protein [Clostridium aceticum]AKL96779.1 hypothetical protein CACET_c33350 [Clostridium aceticum]KJF27536.1 hypothetical protein TZ02_07030 [Clostridium aceticum]
MDKLVIILVSIAAALITYYISITMNKGAVFGSAIVTLVAGFIFPHFFPDKGATLAAVATCASYAGMVAVGKFPKIQEMVAVGFLAGIIFIATTTAFVGVGGRLGTIAAVAGLSWLGIKKLYGMTAVQQKEGMVE